MHKTLLLLAFPFLFTSCYLGIGGGDDDDDQIIINNEDQCLNTVDELVRIFNNEPIDRIDLESGEFLDFSTTSFPVIRGCIAQFDDSYYNLDQLVSYFFANDGGQRVLVLRFPG